jgi:hypothetical protein
VGLWAAGLRAAYPRATAADPALETRIANALADARHFYAVTDPEATAPGGPLDAWLGRMEAEEARRLVSLVYPSRQPEGMDALNEAGEEWLHPSGDGRSSRASYLELLDRGADEAARSIALVLDFWKGGNSAAELARGIGEESLGLSGAEGSALRPRICRPLGLPEAMDAEYSAHVDLSSP